MTAKRFTFDEDVNEDYMYEMGVFSDNGELMETTDVLNCLNNLHEENQSIKKHIRELYKNVKFDVDNEIEVYPKVLLEYIVNILKIIGDVE